MRSTQPLVGRGDAGSGRDGAASDCGRPRPGRPRCRRRRSRSPRRLRSRARTIRAAARAAQLYSSSAACGPSADGRSRPERLAAYEPPSAPPGYFFDIETVLLLPVLKDRITNDFGVAPSGNKLQVPSVALGLTVSPTFEFGYRLPDSAGFFAGSYRFVSSQGTGTSDFDGAAFATRTRVDLELFDLDYGTTMYEVAPNWNIGWRIGASVQNIFFDSRIQNGSITQQASNNYFGSGAHGRFDVERRIEAVRGLSLFGRIDANVLIGELTQRFREDDVLANGSTVTSIADFRHSQSVPTLLVQVGVSYIPPIFTNVKFTTGYQFEDYWYLGQFNTNATPGSSRAELQTQGWFLRGQVDF